MRQYGLIILISLIVLFLFLSLVRNIFSYRDKVDYYDSLKTEHDSELDRNKELKSDIRKSEDYYFIEKQIREKLNLLKPEETAYIIPDITTTPTPTPQITKTPQEAWKSAVLNEDR